MLHNLLERQLRKAGLSNENLPNSLENWQKLLDKVNSTYIQNENDHYLLQRSLQISSQEMLGRWMELQESNQRKQVIFDSALDSLVISKVDGTITEYNITAKNTFHWSQSDSIGKNIKEFISYENRELDLTELAITELFLASVMNGKIDQKKIFKAEMLGKKQTNEKFPIETYCVPINFKRETVYLWYIRDLTSQKEYEAIIEMQQLNLISASKLATLGEMAANIAHEINNPLTTIKIITEMVRRYLSSDNPQIEDSINKLDALKKTIDRIANIIKNLQSFARDGSADPFQEENLNKIIVETLSFCDERFKKNSVKLYLDEFPTDLVITCRGVQISQVLLNLLNNAFDAIETQEEKWIRITVVFNPNSIQISITDSGPGIPNEIADKVFKPFFTTKKMNKGTGLGLSISRKIIEEHKGNLFLDTTSRNTRFVIELPKTI